MKKILIVAFCFVLTQSWAGRTFNGASNYVNIPGNGTPIDSLTSAMTMAIWFNPSSIPGTEADFISKWGSGGNHYLLNFSQVSAGQVGVAFGESGVPSIVNFTCGTTISTINVWHHVAATWDQAGGAATIYLDGNSCAFVAAHGPLIPSGHNLFLGARDTGLGQPFPGKLAEAGIWNVVLNNREIAALAKGEPPNRIRRLSLVGYFPLYGAATPEPDLSGNLDNGALSTPAPLPANHCPCGSPAGVP